MAKEKKTGRKRKRKLGPMRKVPKKVSYFVTAALRFVRSAKLALEKHAPASRKVFGELHNVESRLSRLI